MKKCRIKLFAVAIMAVGVKYLSFYPGPEEFKAVSAPMTMRIKERKYY
jgi:hypothetical protein